MRSLSKSKLLAYRQCPKRLWLEIHRSDLIEWTDQAQANFLVGHEVGGIAQTIYDPKGKGVVFDPAEEGYDEVVIRISELAKRFPGLARPLLAINERLVDLLPIASEHYYHPDQQGKWSIKCILPTIAPDLSHDALDGVKDGGMAMTAYREAIHPDTTDARKAVIKRQLLDYCRLDTEAMVRVWRHFAGRADLKS